MRETAGTTMFNYPPDVYHVTPLAQQDSSGCELKSGNLKIV